VAGGWAVFWNDLLDGAPPGAHRTMASGAARIGRALTARSRVRTWFAGEFRELPAASYAGAGVGA
jgi:hypothetical protein